MNAKLRTTLALTHGFVAVITIFLVLVVTYVLVNQRFLTYVSQNQYKEHQKLVETYEQMAISGKWDKNNLTTSGLEAMNRGYLITLKDEKGKVIWDSSMVGKDKYDESLSKIKERIVRHFGVLEPSIQSNNYKLKSGDRTIGILEVRYYSVYFLTDHDLMFLNYLNASLLWIGGISFLLSILLSTLISNKISSQISYIIKRAKELVSGKKDVKPPPLKSWITEINDLIGTVSQLDENLKEKEASNKRLTSDIAHELRTPLTTLQSHLEALMEGIWQPTQERLASCHEEIVRMAALVKDLEQLNKYDTGQINVIRSSFDLAELAKNIITNFQSDYARKKVELRFSGRECLLQADREKLGQVIVNLLANSLKYTPVGGKVFLHVNCDQNFAYIVTNDNGIGISAQDLPHIFNRLYRADVSRTRTTGGAGIGLSVAKAIVEAHDGQIGVVSQEGKGSEFSVILPREFNNTKIEKQGV